MNSQFAGTMLALYRGFLFIVLSLSGLFLLLCALTVAIGVSQYGFSSTLFTGKPVIRPDDEFNVAPIGDSRPLAAMIMGSFFLVTFLGSRQLLSNSNPNANQTPEESDPI